MVQSSMSNNGWSSLSKSPVVVSSLVLTAKVSSGKKYAGSSNLISVLKGIYSISKDKTICLLDTETGKAIRSKETAHE